MADQPQPFKYHAQPEVFGMKTLAADAKIAAAITQASGDVLLVPPSPVSENGQTERIFFAPSIRVVAAAAPLVAGDVLVILKTPDGRIAGLGSNAGGEVAGDIFSIGFIGFVLDETQDSGYFVRVNAANVTVDAMSSTADMRGCDPLAVDLTAVFPAKQVLYQNNEFGRAQVAGAVVESEGFAFIENFDSVQHIVRFFISDGVNEFEITKQAPAATPAGVIGQAQTTGIPSFPTLPQGWSLSAALDSVNGGVATKAPRVLFSMQPTNGAARSDQAGAF